MNTVGSWSRVAVNTTQQISYETVMLSSMYRKVNCVCALKLKLFM
jgi:hypothetical protein